jgi:putative membrane protein
MKLIVKLLISTLAVLLTAYLLPGIHVSGFFSAFGFAVVLAIVNFLVRPLLILISLPITIITFGLFLLIINGLMVMFAGLFVPGFSVHGLLSAILFSIILSLITYILERVTHTGKHANQ